MAAIGGVPRWVYRALTPGARNSSAMAELRPKPALPSLPIPGWQVTNPTSRRYFGVRTAFSAGRWRATRSSHGTVSHTRTAPSL